MVGDTKDGRYFTYYAHGRVKTVYSDPARTFKLAHFTYDAQGKRLMKESYATDGSTPTERTWYLRDASGAVISYIQQDLITQTRTEELPIAGVGSYLREAQTVRYDITDHLGNTRVSFIVGTNGLDVIEAHDYYPHGGLLPGRQLNGSNGSPLAYQGQEFDPEVGLTAFDHRQYDARLGRWLTTDPYGQHYSPYLAMSNNPVSFVDPDGGYDYNYTNSNLSPEEINWIEREKRLNREWDATLGRGKNPMTVGLGDGVSVGADGNPFGGPAMNALILKYTSTKRVHTPYDLGWGVTGSTFRNETIVDWAALKNDPAYKALIAPQTHSQHSSPRTSGQTISQGKPFDTQSVRSTSQFSLFNDPLVSKVKSANDIISSSFGLFAAGYKLESWGTPAKYAQRFNGLVESAKSISITRVDKAIRLGTHLTKLNTGLTLLGTSYSASKVINAFVHGGVEAINKWDAIDTMVGVAGLAGPSLVTLGLVSNPVGWGIGAGAAIYGISRFLYDYNNPD